ncbi:MAG: TonB-dependent receptor [Bacteroidaceae bacterium]|nr:TonB-dependent receptor [Bacteroidaceae bacterium]
MKHLLAFIFTLLSFTVYAQQGTVRGRVADARTGENIEYATVALLSPKDSTLKGGTVTDGSGHFRLEAPYGRYLLRITFVGYEPQYYKSIVSLSAEHSSVNLGKVSINPQATMMEAVEVSAERSMVEYQLDKRVVNVDKNIVAGGGTASDVLEQVPSVAIDNDGNVTLRGSGNVKVLVNGRPSELLASDLATLLEQIPASTVENVEVITNPSAKYDPEGMSGIINIKLKDKTAGALGLNGVASVNFGAPLPFMVPDSLPSFIPTAMGNISLNYTTEKYNLFLNADLGRRARGNYGVTDIAHRTNGIDYLHDSLHEYSLNPGTMGSVKVGGEYYFNAKNSLLLSYQLRGGSRKRNSWIYAHDLLHNDSMRYDQFNQGDNSNLNHSVNLLYTMKTDRKDEELTFDATFSARQVHGTGSQEQTFYGPATWDNYFLRESVTENDHQALNVRLNYLRPLDSFLGKDGWRLETGYEGRMDWPDQRADYTRTQYDSSHVMVSYPDQISSTHFKYNLQVHAIYATLGGSLTDRLSLQAGLRGEYAYTYGKDLKHPGTPAVDKPYKNIYPTLHLSYKINDMQSAQLSYSRRVRRPHMWDLNPYINVMDGRHLGFGNPTLDPEFTNAFELSYNMGFEKVNIYTAAYFRHSNNTITWYGVYGDSASVAQYAWWEPYNSDYEGYWAAGPQNLANSYNYGLEFIFDWQMTSWWKMNVSLNLYNERIEGTSLLNGDTKELFQASGKLNSFMTLPHDWTLQLSGQYRAPGLDLQARLDPSYWFDLAVKKDILQQRGTINLRVSDFLCTGGWGHFTDNEELYRVVKNHRLSPMVTIGFSWKINNGLKQKPQQQEDEGGDESAIY